MAPKIDFDAINSEIASSQRRLADTFKKISSENM